MKHIDISSLIEAYRSLNLDQVIDHDKFNQYAITHHSTSIEGSTLTANETQMLLDEGVTPAGKPLLHSLMVKDHFQALQYVLKMSGARSPVSTETIKIINALVFKHTGIVYETVFGSIDASKGEFRKGNVQAGGTYFINYDKVIPYTEVLTEKLRDQMTKDLTMGEQIELGFSAHFDLVTIHPFYDSNGRTSRLLMNYIQGYYNLPLAIVFTEDKALYFEALQQTRKQQNKAVFYDFMYSQYGKRLQNEIDGYQAMMKEDRLPPDTGKGFSLFF